MMTKSIPKRRPLFPIADRLTYVQVPLSERLLAYPQPEALFLNRLPTPAHTRIPFTTASRRQCTAELFPASRAGYPQEIAAIPLVRC
jgi:hypothetical protein